MNKRENGMKKQINNEKEKEVEEQVKDENGSTKG
jgi:hypothetical protein